MLTPALLSLLLLLLRLRRPEAIFLARPEILRQRQRTSRNTSPTFAWDKTSR